VGLLAAVLEVAGEPMVGLALAGVAAAREHGADVVAAIGGGSVIDAGKAVAMLLGNGGDPLDYLRSSVPAGRLARLPCPASRCPPRLAPVGLLGHQHQVETALPVGR